MAAVFVGSGAFAFVFAAVVTGAGVGAGAGSEPRRPTLRDSLLKKPSDDELALAFAEAVLDGGAVLVIATMGSPLELDEAKLNDGVPSGARGIVAWEGTVPGAGPLEATA